MNDVICIPVNAGNRSIEIYDQTGQSIRDFQLNPFWSGKSLVADRIEACFKANLPPLSVSHFLLARTRNEFKPSARTTLIGRDFKRIKRLWRRYLIKKQSVIDTSDNITLIQENVELTFSPRTGMLQSVAQIGKNGLRTEHKIEASLMTYGTNRTSNQKSGAYIFVPDRTEPEVLKMQQRPSIVITEGPLISKYEAHIQGDFPIRVVTRIARDSASIRTEFDFDLGKIHGQNIELVIRYKTSLKNGNIFYTDLNGFQVSCES